MHATISIRAESHANTYITPYPLMKSYRQLISDDLNDLSRRTDIDISLRYVYMYERTHTRCTDKCLIDFFMSTNVPISNKK